MDPLRFFNRTRVSGGLRLGILVATGTAAAGQATKAPTGQASKVPTHTVPVRRTCPGGLGLRASAGTASQGALVLVEVTSAKALPSVASEWDGKPTPLWKEGGKSAALHGLIGIDLEKPPGQYEWKITWTGGADGNELSCSLPLTVRAGKFPTEHLKVENQYVQPDPEQQKRVEED